MEPLHVSRKEFLDILEERELYALYGARYGSDSGRRPASRERQ